MPWGCGASAWRYQRLVQRVVRADDLGANFQTLGSQHVTLFTVGVVHQGNTAVTVGVVFNGLHQTFDVKLVALEVDHAVEAAVATPR